MGIRHRVRDGGTSTSLVTRARERCALLSPSEQVMTAETCTMSLQVTFDAYMRTRDLDHLHEALIILGSIQGAIEAIVERELL